MTSTFFALETSIRGLEASQTALQVVGNNIANVGTTGYTRQVVDLEPTAPTQVTNAGGSPLQIGTGVEVAGVTQVRNQYLDQQVWTANGQSGALSTLTNLIGQAQATFNEPSAGGIGAQLTNLFNSFSGLASSPQDTGQRTSVLSAAQALTNTIHGVSASLAAITPQINNQIGTTVASINQVAGQIADLNNQIGIGVANGTTPNTLLDQRGQLISQLSQLVNIQVAPQKNLQTGADNGQVNIDIGGFSLVQENSANTLPVTYTTGNGSPDSGPALTVGGNATIPLQSGQLYGLIRASTQVAGYQSGLDTLAYNLVKATNQAHQAGYGLDGSTSNVFFTPLTTVQGAAADIQVDPGVLNNPNKIAAAAAPTPPNSFAPGNGDNANALANLASTPVIGSASLDSYYNANIAGIGADAQAYQQQSTTQTAVLSQLQNQQSSVSGVNLDEELTRMMQYQRSYQAAAKFLNMADSFLDQVINNMGAAHA